jgi:hypothetical protein
MINSQWFSFSLPLFWIRRIPVRLFTCFNRQSHELSTWGVGVLYINGHHLVYVGDVGVTIFFVRVLNWSKP